MDGNKLFLKYVINAFHVGSVKIQNQSSLKIKMYNKHFYSN